MNIKGIMAGVLLAAVALAALPASAADCNNDTRRSIKGFNDGASVRTYLNNKTSGTTVVGRVYRGGEQKDQALLGPGQSMVQVSTTSNGSDETADIEIFFAPNDDPNLDDSGRNAASQAHCSFELKYVYNDIVSRVSKVSCPDMGVVCPGCTINCKRSWNADKGQWHMHFNLIEPSK